MPTHFFSYEIKKKMSVILKSIFASLVTFGLVLTVSITTTLQWNTL